jgi:hypothetical protein
MLAGACAASSELGSGHIPLKALFGPAFVVGNALRPAKIVTTSPSDFVRTLTWLAPEAR